MGPEWDLKDEEDSERAGHTWGLVCGNSSIFLPYIGSPQK